MTYIKYLLRLNIQRMCTSVVEEPLKHWTRKFVQGNIFRGNCVHGWFAVISKSISVKTGVFVVLHWPLKFNARLGNHEMLQKTMVPSSHCPCILMDHVNECRTTLVKNSIYESFDITFMKNEKNCQNINYFFFFP